MIKNISAKTRHINNMTHDVSLNGEGRLTGGTYDLGGLLNGASDRVRLTVKR